MKSGVNDDSPLSKGKPDDDFSDTERLTTEEAGNKDVPPSEDENYNSLANIDDKQRENLSYTPKLIKSLMHRNVLKISSGGVHNICIVEPEPNYLSYDLFKCFMSGKFADVQFLFTERIPDVTPKYHMGKNIHQVS